MTVPLGTQDMGRKILYSYDSTGKQTGMHVVPVEVASQTALDSTTADETKFYYDDNSSRVKMVTTDNGSGHEGTYYFVYDPTASIPAVVYEQGPAHRYFNLREPDGSLVSRETYNSSGVRTMSRTYHYDGLGSTVALTDETGAVTDKYSYDEWGKLLAHTDATGGQQDLTTDNPYQYVGRYGYYTHYQEPNFALLQLGVRYYDPSIGRFTQRDQLETLTQSSPYGYADAAPVLAVDPNGLDAVIINRQQAYWLQSMAGSDTYVRCVYMSYRRYVTSFSFRAFLSCVWSKTKGLTWWERAALAKDLAACAWAAKTAPVDGGAALCECLRAKFGSPDSVVDVGNMIQCVSAGLYKKKQMKSIFRCRRCSHIWYQNEAAPAGWDLIGVE